MNRRIEALESGDSFDSFFVIASEREALTKKGSRFLNLTVQDRTGTAAAKIWDPDLVCPDGLQVPGVYRLAGVVESYRDELQLKVNAAAPYTPTADEYDALVPISAWSPDTLLAEIRLHVVTHVRATALRRLLLHVLDHPAVVARIGTSPAAVTNHHAYRSGLAEHTLSGMRLGTRIAHHYARYYPGMVDADLLIAGFLLHDLGKVWELEGDLATRYSMQGQLVGHIPAGSAFIADVARELGDIPESLVLELQHLVLSHHGLLEYGSPQQPKTIEAQLLHYIDQIDAKLNTFVGLLRTPGWTGYQRNFGHALLEPSALRAAWTEPAPGERAVDGPGGRVPPFALDADAGESTPPSGPTSASEPAQPTSPPPSQTDGLSATTPVAPGTWHGSPMPEPLDDAQPVPPETLDSGAFSLDPIPDASPSGSIPAATVAPKRRERPDADRCDRTLSLFDGLD